MGFFSMFSCFTRTAYASIVYMFYSNIIEHDLDESYLKSSLFGIVVKVTIEVIVEVLGIPLVEASSVSELEITSELLDRVSIDLVGVEFLYIFLFSNQWVPLIPYLGIEVRNKLRVPLVLRMRCAVVELRSKLLNFVLDLMYWIRKFLHNPPCCLSRFLLTN
ncbi:hypothetical protein AAG906_002203 [Vitis piasezkii]